MGVPGATYDDPDRQPEKRARKNSNAAMEKRARKKLFELQEWRRSILLAAGFGAKQADEMLKLKIDVHEAEALVQRGASPTEAMEILRPI